VARVLLVALVLFGCRSSAPALAPDRATLAMLPPLGLALNLPAGSAVYERPAGTWVLDLRPGMRTPKRVILAVTTPSDPAVPPTHEGSPPWEGPMVLRIGPESGIVYHTRVGDGGSGGVQADLHGRWTLPDRALSVGCVVQEEPILSEGPDPAFCLPLLAAARVIPVTAAPAVLGPELSGVDPLAQREHLIRQIQAPFDGR